MRGAKWRCGLRGSLPEGVRGLLPEVFDESSPVLETTFGK